MFCLLYKTVTFYFSVGLYSDTQDVKSWQEYQPAARSVLLCSYHVLASFVRYQSTYIRQNRIYLLSGPNFLIATGQWFHCQVLSHRKLPSICSNNIRKVRVELALYSSDVIFIVCTLGKT